MLACSLLRSPRHWHLTLLQLGHFRISTWGFPGGGRAEEPGSAGDRRDAGSILAAGRSPGGEHDNPPQYSCLENPMDRGAWWATVHGVTKGQTQLKGLSKHTVVNGRIYILVTCTQNICQDRPFPVPKQM